jgi:serine/threonine protein kinase
MAPELFEKGKKARGYDTSVDQWALGVILYELYMGNKRTPFRFSVKSNEDGTFEGSFDERPIKEAGPLILQRIGDMKSDVSEYMHIQVCLYMILSNRIYN